MGKERPGVDAVQCKLKKPNIKTRFSSSIGYKPQTKPWYIYMKGMSSSILPITGPSTSLSSRNVTFTVDAGRSIATFLAGRSPFSNRLFLFFSDMVR